AAKSLESALRRPEPPSASSSSEPSLYVHECPPPQLPIDHPHSAGSLAGCGCRLICAFGGAVGSMAMGRELARHRMHPGSCSIESAHPYCTHTRLALDSKSGHGMKYLAGQSRRACTWRPRSEMRNCGLSS